MRTGIANLPLHWGTMPAWLFSRMTRLARAIIEAMVYEFGNQEVLVRLSDPYWFQSFGCVLGFDWHSSGLSTTVCGAIKEALRGTENELGIFVAGGKGKTSRKAPNEIELYGEKYSIRETPNLIYASKMSAKVDNTAVQDGFQIYAHTFIFTKSGQWAVIQQGMNPEIGMARRYHWLSDQVKDFVNEPHSAVCCDWRGKILNLVARESELTRQTSVSLVTDNFQEFLKDLNKIKILEMPKYHDITPIDFDSHRLQQTLFNLHEQKPKNFEQLLGVKGVGPKTIRALALVSEVIYGAKPSREDPVRYSFAHGGKDGTPYPVNQKQYDKSIEVLEKAIRRAKIGQRDKIEALKSLSGGQTPFL
ncbi:MAG: DUF763 domain-containing protein [candidate division WOR-3 bacterium]